LCDWRAKEEGRSLRLDVTGRRTVDVHACD
jgi:hypothetical protein